MRHWFICFICLLTEPREESFASAPTKVVEEETALVPAEAQMEDYLGEEVKPMYAFEPDDEAEEEAPFARVEVRIDTWRSARCV